MDTPAGRPDGGALLLFDIDGTLLNAAGCGLRAIDRAMRELYGIDRASAGVEFAGCTDLAIWQGVFTQRGLGVERFHADRPAIETAYLRLLHDELGNRGVTVLPGYPGLLDACRDRGWELGLLTGNFRAGGYAKLAAGRLDGYFPFGGFGDSHTSREPLYELAVTAARTTAGCDVPPKQMLVIGNTLHDLRCARTGGARAVLVATGLVAAATLRAAQPDLFCDSFADVDATVSGFAALLAAAGPAHA
ncbi:MAG TPA: HAD hydrolase-like protein [bacterium]|nr:HAD hydrolase-like protein [bacterium]